jgi:hypothetical protein
MVALIGVGCSNAPAETGSGGSGDNTAATAPEQAVRFVECTRDNNVGDFTDPDTSGTLTYDGIVTGSSKVRAACDVSRGAPAAFRLETQVVHSSLITFMALALSSIVVSIVLALRGKAMSWPERIGLFGLAVYLPFVLGLTLGGIPMDVGAVDPSGWRGWANLVPFGTIGPQLAAGLASDLRQLAGNLLILGPLGFGLPVVWQRFRRPAPLLIAGFGVAFGIEFSQVVISLILGVPYRVFDVDDLMLNTAGAMIGWVAWRESLGLIPRANESPTGGVFASGETP